VSEFECLLLEIALIAHAVSLCRCWNIWPLQYDYALKVNNQPGQASYVVLNLTNFNNNNNKNCGLVARAPSGVEAESFDLRYS